MNTSGEAAEQIVRLSLEGFEVAAKITGSGAKNIAVLLYTLMKDKQKTSGKTNLTNMLKSGKELKVFSVKAGDFQKFTQEAKRYGVLYSALINKKSDIKDGVVDIMIRVEDAPKINRIIQRFKLSSYEEASIRSDIEKTRNELSKGLEHKDKDKVIEEDKSLNPHLAKTEKSPLSKPSLDTQKVLNKGSNLPKESVRDKLDKIKKEIVKKDLKTNRHKDMFKKKKYKEKNL